MKRILLSIAVCLSVAFGVICQGEAKPVVSILGDSYSTFDGYIPEGNATWYYNHNQNGRTDVIDVRQTWWWQLISEGNYLLGSNESYSGSTVSFTGYRGEDYSDRSFITRLPRIVPSDILLIFGGTNDSWVGGPMGDYKYRNFTRGHFYEFRPAMGKLLIEAQNRFPGTRIVFIINSDLRDDIVESIKEVCRRCAVEYIELHDIDKKSSHPSIQGMTQIKDQILNFLK